MKQKRNKFFLAAGFLIAFLVWTIALQLVDVQAIGLEGTTVGFATMNKYMHELTGVHMSLYDITDLLSIIPLAVIAGFGIMGLCQFIKRKKLGSVDYNILMLGAFYVVVMAVFLFFEVCVLNYRPVLIEGKLEASYPSSTTMLAMCVMPTAIMQLRFYIKNKVLKQWLGIILTGFTLFMVIARLISGVHWFSDIIGGALFSAGVVILYHAFVSAYKK